MNRKKVLVAVLIVILVVIIGVIKNTKVSTPENNPVAKIGVISDFTGPAVYWGESTRAGVDLLARNELTALGMNADITFEDYGMDPAKAISAAQKLVNVDKVDAVYIELNPGTIATAAFFKEKNIPVIYDAAITSPLKDSPLFYKTYLNFQEGCKQIAQKFKDEGVTKMGMLKMNLEAGELCEMGVKEIYGNNLISEGYNLGDTDFRTQLLKIKNAGAGAVINMAFESDTFNTLKVIRDLKYNLLYGTVDDSVTDNVKTTFGPQLKGAWTFGFDDPAIKFKNNIDDKEVASPYAAALAYTHVKQLVGAINKCGKDNDCVIKFLDASPADNTIGFQGFKNHIADLTMKLKKY